MIKLSLLFTMTMSFAVLAESPVPASDLVLKEITEFCVSEAKEFGTDGKDFDTYVLDCVNEELATDGYQPVKKLPPKKQQN